MYQPLFKVVRRKPSTIIKRFWFGALFIPSFLWRFSQEKQKADRKWSDFDEKSGENHSHFTWINCSNDCWISCNIHNAFFSWFAKEKNIRIFEPLVFSLFMLWNMLPIWIFLKILCVKCNAYSAQVPHWVQAHFIFRALIFYQEFRAWQRAQQIKKTLKIIDFIGFAVQGNYSTAIRTDSFQLSVTQWWHGFWREAHHISLKRIASLSVCGSCQQQTATTTKNGKKKQVQAHLKLVWVWGFCYLRFNLIIIINNGVPKIKGVT